MSTTLGLNFADQRKAKARLVEILGLSPLTTSLRLEFLPDRLPTMIVERPLTPGEVEALAEWYETEGLTTQQTAETTYSLVKREKPAPPAASPDGTAAASDRPA